MSGIVFASSHTSLTLFLVIYDGRSRTSLAPTWIIILLNLCLALASTFKFDKMSGALAPGKQRTMGAGVSIFTFRTIESPITRALSSGFSVGASLSGENLFDVLIGAEERCFDPRLCRLTVTQLLCCMGSSRTEQCTGLPGLVAPRTVSTALTFLLSSTKVWMRVSSSKIFSVSLTTSLHLSYVNPSLLTEIDKLYMWQTVQKTIAGEEAITHVIDE